MEALSSMVNRSQGFTNNRQSTIDNSKRVDVLILDVEDLIDPAFRLWFVKRFYKLSDDTVRRLAASVREQVAAKPNSNPIRLFSWLIKREAGF